MSTNTINALDVEQERKQQLDELIAEHGQDYLHNFKPGSFGCHELLDRSALAGDLVEREVLSHPACVQNPQWYALAEKAVAALRELYQEIGKDHMKSEP